MTFLYGLALALIFFEGFISQCESAGGSKKASSSAKLQDLPIELLGDILRRTGFNGTRNAAELGLRSLDAAKRIVEKSIIHICPVVWDNEDMNEYTLDGDNYLVIYDVDKILPFFKHFGDVIKKIRLDYRFNFTKNEDIIRGINKKIKEHPRQFTELHIVLDDYTSFLDTLDKMSNRRERIEFLNVKKFVFEGVESGNSYDLNSIFPNLEYLNFRYNPFFLSIGLHDLMKIDMTCLENFTKLKELQLKINPDSYELPELENIFKKNKLSSFAVVLVDNIDILHSIEKHMKTVETLEIHIDETEFLNQVHENHQYKMPNLKRLLLSTGELIMDDPRIIIFINSFKKLNKLDEIVVKIDYHIQEMEDMIVKSNLTNLKRTLGIFGTNDKLIMRMWIHDEMPICNTYKSKVIEFNEELRQSQKPAWEIKTYERSVLSHMTFLRSE